MSATVTRRRRTPLETVRSAAATTGFQVVAAGLAIAFLFPIGWALLSSFKTQAEAGASPPSLWPRVFSVENYRALFEYGAGLPQYAWNSLVVSAVTVVGTLVVASLGGYGFARFTFRGKNLVFAVVIAVLMVPQASLVLPLYSLLSDVGLADSVVGVGLVMIVFQLPFSIFLMRNSFESIPREMEEAALVDGCSNLGTFRRISLPVVAPGLVTVALFAFLNSWNEFLIPLVLLNDGSKFTLSLMLVNIRSGSYGAVDWGMLQAGTVTAIIPCLVLYLLLQRFYVGGLVSGSVRG